VYFIETVIFFGLECIELNCLDFRSIYTVLVVLLRMDSSQISASKLFL